MNSYNYYNDYTGSSPRWDGEWVRVLPVPDRYPQDMELLEVQQSVMSRLIVHTTAYQVVRGLRGTLKHNTTTPSSDILTLTEGIIWCHIGDGYYIHIPSTQVVVPPSDHGCGLLGSTGRQLGIQLVKEVVGVGYDPILGSIPPPLWDIPLDRMRVCARYVWDTPDMLPVLAIHGTGPRIHYYSDVINPLRDTLMRQYMREVDGDYIAYGMAVTYSGGWVHVGAGRAWVGGRPIEVEAQSIPYKDGTLQLCSDGLIAIEVRHDSYIPEYSAIVSSDGRPILMGGVYGVVLPHAAHNPYLIPYECIPLALLDSGVVVDVGARLPTDSELLALLTTIRLTAGNQPTNLGDITHPLYNVRVVNGGIHLPRIEQVVAVPDYVPPHNRLLLEASTVRTDWIDSAPTPSTPPPPPPFLHALRLGNEYTVRGYNLVPGNSYIPNPAATKVMRGNPVGTSITADIHGMVEYTAPTVVDLSGLLPTDTPNLSVGLGQSFAVVSPTMVGSVSLYLRAGYYGVVSICKLQATGSSYQPYGPPLTWVPVAVPTAGWVDINIGPVYLEQGIYGLISQSIVGSVIGRRHYLLPTLEGTPETTNSMSMLLSQDGIWQLLPNMDIMYRIHKAVPTATYRDRYTTIEWGEAFDGYEYISNYQLPPGTYITCTAFTKEGGSLLGKVFAPRTSIVLAEALFGTATLFPSIRVGSISLFITSKRGTWISREQLVGQYSSVTVTLKAYIPEGSSISVHVGSGGGWVELGISASSANDITGGQYSYYIGNLSPTTSSTDINGTVRQVMRDRVRTRIELSTTSPEVQPYVWDVVTTTN